MHKKMSDKDTDTPVVLIVEDEFFIRHSLAECFRDAGYVVIEAANAKHAMAAYRDGLPVQILITDIELNDSASGWDVAEAFRSLWSDIPIIYVSGKAPDPTRTVANSLFIGKPYRPTKVVAACRQLMAANG